MEKLKVTVIIPTKNPGKNFSSVLEMVLTQETPWEFEVLVIDSGSSDGTVEYCQSLGNKIRFYTIPPEEFGHGKTRNLAISKCSSEFVALLTHDALPASAHWLRKLVEATEQMPDVAGTFGRHLPYPGGNPFVAREINQHFDHFLTWKPIFRMDDPQRYQDDVGYRQVLHYFSDNNACLRRSVWEKIPYPDVNFAEDQIWAKQIIEAGYGKAYADEAAVFHSHSFSVIELGKRAFDEGRAFLELFGYCLCPNLNHLFRQAFWCTVGDFRYAWNNKLMLKYPQWVVRSPFLNLSRQLGFYLGARVHKLPMTAVKWLSLDQALKTGL